MSSENDGGMILTGENRRTRGKTCPSATLSTTNPTWIDSGANQGLRGERPATNDLSQGMAQYSVLLQTGRPGYWDSMPGRVKKIFPLASVSSLAEAQPASCTMGTGGPFPGGKARPGRDTDHSPLSSTEIKNE
jgi:hypothetical protein